MCPRRCGVWYIPGTRTQCWSTRGEQTSTGLGEHERPRWQPAYGARDRQDPAAGPREARSIAPAGRGGHEDPGQVPPRPGEGELRGAACRVYARLSQDLRRAPWTGRSGNDQAAEVPPSREPRGLLASLDHLIGIGGTIEDEAGTMAPVHRPGLYVSLVVVLIFVLATYVASSIRGEAGRPSISVVQEPTVSQLPSGIALVGNVEDEVRISEDPNKEVQPESPAIDDIVKAEQSGQEKYAPRAAQMPSSATAVASASASAS